MKRTHEEVSDLIAKSAQILTEAKNIPIDRALMEIGRKYPATGKAWYIAMREKSNASKK